MAEVRLERLSHRYPDNPAATLEDLSLLVPRGEAHALLGSSGAGKTTLLSLLAGLLVAPPGCIFFDGKDVSALAPWARKVTQVFQFPVLYEAMTVAENLRFPMRMRPAAEQRLRVQQMAERLGIEGILERRPGALTLVEKQLVAIGKALSRPDVSLVLLDEPLTAAAPEHKWSLRQTLRSVQKELGATMIYVTHDQTEALTFADRVSVLHNGRILQTATPARLLAAPAHEHVGYFVGSPGMNLLPGAIISGEARVDGWQLARVAFDDGPCRLGFRPEGARIVRGDSGVPVEVSLIRILGEGREGPIGLVTSRFADHEVLTRQPLGGLEPGPARLLIDPDALVVFRNGWRVQAHA